MKRAVWVKGHRSLLLPLQTSSQPSCLNCLVMRSPGKGGTDLHHSHA